jgi:uracil-DNA glycosylase
VDATVSDENFDEELDPLDELASITLELQAYLEWQLDSGAIGVPRDTGLAQRLRENPLPRFNASSPTGEQPRTPDPMRPAPQTQAAPNQVDLPSRGSKAPEPQRPATAGHFAPPVFDEPRRAPKTPLAPIQKQERIDPHLVVLGATLEEVQARVAGCTLCELSETRTQTVFSRGTGSSGLCFVGSSPDAEDEALGQPFVGPAGQLLDKMIEAMGFDRDEVYVCSVVKCRPPEDRNPTVIELKTCGPYLRRQLDLLKPQVIVALGSTAVSGLLGLSEGITRLRGNFRLYQGRTAVMPTFAPAYLLRNPAAKRQVWTDLRQVVHHMGRELPRK